MRRLWRLTELVLLPTIGLAAALVIAPARATLAMHVWLLVVLGLAFLTLLGVVRSAYPRTPSPFAASLRQPRASVDRPASLARMEREISIAATSAFDAHHRLRPGLIELAAGLLASRRGIDLERDPDRAHAVLGDDVWELVRPDRPQPTDKLAGGIGEAHLERIVTAMERI